MKVFLFVNKNQKIRSIWWVAIFFLVLAAITLPIILLSAHYHFEVSMSYQVIMVLAASCICQLLRKKPITEIVGTIDRRWLKMLFAGIFIGAALMLTPALFLTLTTQVHWKVSGISLFAILPVTFLFIAVAIAEELLFRGFIFQRLIKSVGEWPAQLVIGGLFLLTHINNPGMTGSIKVFAGINIFLASIMFGLAFIRTKSLAMPIGLHFMANWVQGVLLGFGVSGNEETSLLKPVFNNSPAWLTGGNFGLEASLPGLVCVVMTIIFLFCWKPVKSPEVVA